MEIPWNVLADPTPSLFIKSNKKHDPALGEIIMHGRNHFSKEITIGIVGAPTDEGVRRGGGKAGSKEAPQKIRKYLYQLFPFALEKHKQIIELKIFDFGDVRPGLTLEETHQRLQSVIESLSASGITSVVLGGGHDIAYPNFLGFSKNSSSAGMISLQAQLRYTKPGPKRTNDTVIRQILDAPRHIISPMNYISLGAQSFYNNKSHYEELIDRGATIFSLQELHKDGIQKILELAYEIATNSTERLFVDFDMSALRSIDAPGVNTPHPLGVTSEEFLIATFFAGQRRKTSLVDFVELNPKNDFADQTIMLTSLGLMNFFAGVANR